jgi:predicted PurR-regulated permease PerM
MDDPRAAVPDPVAGTGLGDGPGPALPPEPPPLAPPWLRISTGAALALLLLAGALAVLRPFLVPVTWAAVLAFALWPPTRWLRRRAGGRRTLAALLMTALVLVAVIGPLAAVSAGLVEEIRGAAQRIDALQQEPRQPPAWLTGLPVIGGRIAALPRYLEPEVLEEWLRDNVRLVQDLALQAAGRVGRNVLKTGIGLLVLFYFFRDGDVVVAQLRRAARRLGGEAVGRRFDAVGGTIRAVVYGLLVTAAVQGVLAAVGYAVAGVPAPILLGIVTGLLALVPYGTSVVMVPAALWLLFEGETLAAMGLLLWGTLIVASVDNVLRPLFISGAIRVPYLLVFFGVLGGIGAFGLVGVFVGPVLLSALFALWREWAEDGTEP